MLPVARSGEVGPLAPTYEKSWCACSRCSRRNSSSFACCCCACCACCSWAVALRHCAISENAAEERPVRVCVSASAARGDKAWLWVLTEAEPQGTSCRSSSSAIRSASHSMGMALESSSHASFDELGAAAGLEVFRPAQRGRTSDRWGAG